jgi:ABC-type uncharacterized transport system permease subunit
MKYGITALLIALDIISGTIYAIKSKTWTSTKMREGLFHKMAIILFIALAILCDYGQHYLNIGFQIPITNGALTYICFMEIGSTGENIVKINPELKIKVKEFFVKGK